MSRRRKIDIDAIGHEMGAVAAFARSSLAEADALRQDLKRPEHLSSLGAVVRSPLPCEQRTILEGKYEVAVGWDHEPAIEGQANAAAIRIVRANTWPVQPLEAVEETLKVRVQHGAQSREFPLRAVSGEQGYYVADLLPTRAGDYTFTFVGTIERQRVEEYFESGAGRFGGVLPTADVQFPLLSEEAAQATSERAESRPATRHSQALAAVGFGIGLFGVLAALTNWRGRSAQVAPPAAVDGAERSREARPPQPRPETGEAGPPDELGPDFGPTLQQEIALALKPVVAGFRQELAGTLQEQTLRAFEPIVSRHQ